MMQDILREVKVRRWLHRSDLPDEFLGFRRLFEMQLHGDLISNQRNPVPSIKQDKARHSIPPELRPLVSHTCKAVHFVPSLRYCDMRFSAVHYHLGNSRIEYCTGGNMNHRAFGTIKHIFSENGEDFFFSVSEQKQSRKRHPLFLRYPDYPIHMVSLFEEGPLQLVKPAWVLGHTAWLKLDDSKAAVLSLTKVCVLTLRIKLSEKLIVFEGQEPWSVKIMCLER
jgi:hypothetical protein